MIWSVPFLRISTHTPLARRDDRGVDVARAVLISTHTPLARRDPYMHYLRYVEQLISTHTPLARRDVFRLFEIEITPDFYSHASCEARRFISRTSFSHSAISTHTPLARRDLKRGHSLPND